MLEESSWQRAPTVLGTLRFLSMYFVSYLLASFSTFFVRGFVIFNRGLLMKEMKGSGEEGATLAGRELEAKSSHCLRCSAFSHLLASFCFFLLGKMLFNRGLLIMRMQGNPRSWRRARGKELPLS